MEDRAAIIELIRWSDYETVRSLCQSDPAIRRTCNDIFWQREAVNLGLSVEQVADIFKDKPDYVSNAVYFKWLQMWAQEVSLSNLWIVTEKGYLPLVKLYAYLGVDIHDANDYVFRKAAEDGHLDIAKWLYTLGKRKDETEVDIYAMSEYAFRWAAANGHLDMAKWLYSLGGVNIHVEFDYAFRQAAANGHLAMVKWLHSLGVNSHTMMYDSAIRNAAKNGHKDVVAWLNKTGKTRRCVVC